MILTFQMIYGSESFTPYGICRNLNACNPILKNSREVSVLFTGAVRPAARPPSGKVMVSVGIQPIAAGNSKWLDAVTVAAVGREW